MKFSQQPGAVLMIRPKTFGFNPQTASSNTFQQSTENVSEAQALALSEFDQVVSMLELHDISVHVFEDQSEAIRPRPDAIFPNNWISFHEDGTVVLYPMMSENRRWERRLDIIEKLKGNYEITNVIDLSSHENSGRFLEGTGSLVFDHAHKIAYASRSSRTSDELVHELSAKLGYRPVLFSALDEQRRPIYHTNVLLSVGEKFAVVCLDAIPGEDDQEVLLGSFSDSGHRVVAISFAQLRSFAGNILEVHNRKGESIVVLSESALQSLLPGQVNAISQFADILTVKIDTIEKVGGGGIRCMIAGIHLRQRNHF